MEKKVMKPVPLTDADYAEVRARVMWKINHPRRWAPLLRVAAALALVATLAIVRRRESSAPIHGAPPPPAAHAAEGRGAPLPLLQHIAEPKRIVRKTRKQEPMHIEIHTADPDIRIIWLVNPTPPKEES